MPHVEPLKPAAKQDRPKVMKSPPPGATKTRKVRLATRDPRRKSG
jgi:hypothetical protein